jgi:PRELI-like family
MNTAVIGTDVVERTVVNGVLHTHRLVSSRWYFPKWTSKVSRSGD